MRYLFFLFFLPQILFAKPKGAEVVSGSCELRHCGSRLEIHTSDRAIINWEEFSIHAGEVTRFVQPSAQSATLNRVANGVSHIDGLLEASGKVYLFNPQGIVIGKSGEVITSGFIATTLELDNGQFLQGGDLRFKGNSMSTIVNMGKIKALGGDVILLARAVQSGGTIEAPEGMVGIAAAREVLLKPEGMQRLFISPGKKLEKRGRGH